jgi:hypothetical protein
MSEEQERLAAELKRAFRSLRPNAANRDVRTDAVLLSEATAASMSFTPELLLAVLAGKKTETRRPIRPMPAKVIDGVPMLADGTLIPPLVQAGDRLWVREKWARLDDGSFVYAVDKPTRIVRWLSSRFMPRAAARHWLSVERICLARLSTISEDDARAEGADASPTMYGPRAWFFEVWNAIYGGTEFDAANDPWVWVIAFSLVRPESGLEPIEQPYCDRAENKDRQPRHDRRPH